MASLDCPSCGLRDLPAVAYCPECGFPVGQLGSETEIDPLVGKTLTGGYRVVERLAEGSMGRVYRAEQSNLQRAVAVKVMSPSFVADAVMVARFRNEARAASSLNHPNIVRVFDYGETDSRPYLVMELLHGEELAALLKREPLQPVSRVLDWTLQMLSGLGEAHDLGVVHRDLKPENVFVLPQRGGGDLVKVVDFGLAKLRSGATTTGSSGLVFGTPEYISPEQAMAKETDGRADIYACGVMLFEMLSGQLPFEADTPRGLLERHVYDAPPALGELVADRVTFGLDEVVAIALEKDPNRRFQSAESFADALREIVAHRTGDRAVSDRHSWIRQSFKACPRCENRVLIIAKFCGDCGEAMPRESMPSPLALGIGRQQSAQAPDAESLAAESSTSGAAGASPTARPTQQKTPSPTAAAAMRRTTIPELSASRVQGLEIEIRDAAESGDANSALVFLEQIAVSRMRAGDPLAAILALRRGIEVARQDLDRGELEDPIRVVALFSGKLGDALAAAAEFEAAHRAYKDGLALSRLPEERAKLWVSLSRVARECGHDEEALEYLESAEREAAGAARRRSMARSDSTPRSPGRRSSGVG